MSAVRKAIARLVSINATTLAMDLEAEWKSLLREKDTMTIRADAHPSVASLMQFFTYAHLPLHLQEISRPFGELAERVANGPQNAETTAALRKLMEAKDCAVRAVLFK